MTLLFPVHVSVGNDNGGVDFACLARPCLSLADGPGRQLPMAEDEQGEGTGQRQDDRLAAVLDDAEQAVQGPGRGNCTQHIDTDGEGDQQGEASSEIRRDRGILRPALPICIDEEGNDERSQQRPGRQFTQVPNVQPQRMYRGRPNRAADARRRSADAASARW